MEPHETEKLSHIAWNVAQQLADLSMHYFNQGFDTSNKFSHVEQKRDRSLVSVADKAIENLARQLLKEKTPQIGFLGEETGFLKKLGSLNSQNPKAPFLEDEASEILNIDTDTYWLLDPIDGTINFLGKVPIWSVLLALVRNGEPILGVVVHPAASSVLNHSSESTSSKPFFFGGESFIGGRNFPARMGYVGMPLQDFKLCNLSNISHNTQEQTTLSDCLISCTSPKNFEYQQLSQWYISLLQTSNDFRTHSDAFGYTRILTGHVHAMIDTVCAPYDVAALQAIFHNCPEVTFQSFFDFLSGNTNTEKKSFSQGSIIACANKTISGLLRNHYFDFHTEESSKLLIEKMHPKILNLLGSKLIFFAQEYLPPYTFKFTVSASLDKLSEIQRFLWARTHACSDFLSKNQGIQIEDFRYQTQLERLFSEKHLQGETLNPPTLFENLTTNMRCVISKKIGNQKVSSVSQISFDVDPLSIDSQQDIFTLVQNILESAKALLNSPSSISLGSKEYCQGEFGYIPIFTPEGIAFEENVDMETIEILRKKLKSLNGRRSAEVVSLQTSFSIETKLCTQGFLDNSWQLLGEKHVQISLNGTFEKHENSLSCNKRLFVKWSARSTIEQEIENAFKALLEEGAQQLQASFLPTKIDYDYLLVDADLMGLILHEAIGHAAEGDLMATNSSGFANKLGTKVGPDWINIYAESALANCGEIEVDSEGTISRRKTIVRNGIFEAPIQTRDTSLIFPGGLDACARQESLHHPSLARMTSIWIHATQSTPCAENPKMRDIQTIIDEDSFFQNKKIMLLKGWRGGTASCSNLEFRADVTSFVLLEQQKQPRFYREGTFTGIATQCLQSAVKAYGKTVCNTVGMCGKDGQSVPTSDGGPELLLLEKHQNISVFGTDKEEGDV